MQVKTKMFLAKLLIFFSIIFIAIGILFNYSTSNKLHPLDDVTVVADVDDEVSITTTTTGEVINSSNVPIDNDTFVSPPVNNDKQDTIVNNPSDVDTKKGEDTLTVDDSNLKLRDEIQKKYGIFVKYGNDTSGYSVGGMSTVGVSDAEVSKTALNNLNTVLSLYPEGFFQELNSKGYSLTFYIVKRYSTDNVTGVTDSSYKNTAISIATDYDFTDTFHHEVYHYIEKYMINSGAAFTSWDTMNPIDFKYGVINYDYSYAKTISEDAFFVNGYAMTDQCEDRASTFEYMMKNSKAKCLNYGKTIWLKAKTISEQIDFFFNSVTPTTTEYWERHVY